jgi:hypothetical protein
MPEVEAAKSLVIVPGHLGRAQADYERGSVFWMRGADRRVQRSRRGMLLEARFTPVPVIEAANRARLRCI